MIVDTHLHVIDKSALSYPWLAGVPPLDHDFSYEDYEIQAHRAGIAATLHMEVDVAPEEIEAETRYVESLAERPGSLIIGAISSCRPEENDFPDLLARAQANPLVMGFRRVLHVVPDELSEGALFRENLKRIAGTGLTFDLCVRSDQIPKAIALADLAPDVQFIFDHCGVPDIKGGAEQPWRGHVSEMAKRPNVVAKISGVIAYADPGTWTVDIIRPYVEHVISAFGWDRVVWGSDWPVCTLGGGLFAWVSATHALLAGASDNERSKLLSSNAIRLWGLRTAT